MLASTNIPEIQGANAKYVGTFGDKSKLALPPSRKLTVVTCMDARIDPAAALGIQEGEAHIIRNAGGLAKEAIRSIVISQRLLGTTEIILIHHTGCGMLTMTSQAMQDHVKGAIPEASREVDAIDFGAFPELERSVQDDVEFLKGSPLVLKDIAISGWIYEVETGKVRQVV